MAKKKNPVAQAVLSRAGPEITRRLKAAWEKAGSPPRTKLAEASQIDTSTISRLLTGDRVPELEHLIALATALNMPLCDLLPEEIEVSDLGIKSVEDEAASLGPRPKMALENHEKIMGQTATPGKSRIAALLSGDLSSLPRGLGEYLSKHKDEMSLALVEALLLQENQADLGLTYDESYWGRARGFWEKELEIKKQQRKEGTPRGAEDGGGLAEMGRGLRGKPKRDR